MEEFVKEWDRKIDHILTSFQLNDQVEDVKQEIYESMCVRDGDGKNGLDKYDATKASFSTYVYAMVLMKARNAKAKRVRENQIIQHANFYSAEDGDDESMANWSRDRIEAKSAFITGQRSERDKVEFKLQLNDVFEILKSYAPRSVFFREGEVVLRDLTTLLELILKGKSRDEIVSHFEYSTGSVGVMYDALRDVPELQELWEMALAAPG